MSKESGNPMREFEDEAEADDEADGLASNVSSLIQRPVFDHERLDVYKLELVFLTWVTELLDELRPEPRFREVRDQLDRASLSILLNTAEGNGKRQMQLRARFFDDARGSATECAACLDALVAKRACPSTRIEPGKEYLLRIAQMLTKLIQRFTQSRTNHKPAADGCA